MSRSCLWILIAAVATGELLTCPTAAVAADRVVMGEDFTATWCTYCPRAGRALHTLMTNFPNTFTYLQVHEDHIYNLPWGTARQTYYSITGHPTVWFDGKNKCVGSMDTDAAQYS